MKSFLLFYSRLLKEIDPNELGWVGVFFSYLFPFGVLMATVCDAYSGGVRKQTNDGLACVGGLGIRFSFGVLGWS